METNHDGEIDLPYSGLAAACPAGMSRTSDIRVRTNIGRHSDRPLMIEGVVPTMLLTIARSVTRALRAAFNTEGVPDAPLTTDPREAIGVPGVLSIRVAIVLLAHTLPEAVIGLPAARTAVVEIGNKTVVHGHGLMRGTLKRVKDELRCQTSAD